jgi:hypothetical protein
VQALPFFDEGGALKNWIRMAAVRGNRNGNYQTGCLYTQETLKVLALIEALAWLIRRMYLP